MIPPSNLHNRSNHLHPRELESQRRERERERERESCDDIDLYPRQQDLQGRGGEGERGSCHNLDGNISNTPGLIFTRFSFLYSEAEWGFFFKILAIKLLVVSIDFLNTSSEVSYLLQSEASKSTPLSPFLTEKHIKRTGLQSTSFKYSFSQKLRRRSTKTVRRARSLPNH
jgi:hypothetical protein